MEGNLFGFENERRIFTSSSVGEESIQSKIDFLLNEENSSFLSSFFIELINRIKNTLGSIKNYTQLSRGKFSDKEFGEYYYRAVTEDIEKIDMVLNNILNYIKVQKPIRKTNTVHNIIEEVLKKNQIKLDEKGVKVFKKFEKDLPETIVPDEQLKYILHSVLQYALALTPPHLSIGLSTRSFILEKEGGQVQDMFMKDGRHIEISVIFPGVDQSSETPPKPTVRKEEASDLILRFVKEVVLRNHGRMRIGADEKKTKTFISLRFPVERRRVFYYPSVN